MMLAYPDLTETDKLMLKMKYKRDQFVETRQTEKGEVFEDIKEIKVKSQKYGKKVLNVPLQKALLNAKIDQ